MKLLTDADLKSKIDNGQPPLVEGVSTNEWQTQGSPIQPCSIDLRIGKIQVPAQDESEAIREILGRGKEYRLKTGATAVVTTEERLHMPACVAGVGFPPSSVSIRGLLMTNPGHVDPGYEGPMHFTVINMAREDFVLTIGQRICTLLFFELDSGVASDWKTRNPPVKDLTAEDVNRLARDFVNVEKRATKIAKRAVRKAEWFAAGIAAVVTLLSQFVPYWVTRAEDLKKNYAVLESRVDYLQKEVNALEARAPAVGSALQVSAAPRKSDQR